MLFTTQIMKLLIFQAITQRFFHCPLEDTIRLQKTIAPVYSYFFDYKIQFGFGDFLSRSNVNLGISHGEDVLLLYTTPLHAYPFVYTDEEKLMSKKLLEIYATFAETG
jgi:carboxylesterase type B